MPDDLRLEGERLLAGAGEEHVPAPLRVAEDPVAHLGGEVQPAAVVLEHLHDADRLHDVVEAAREDLGEEPLPGVAERRVAEVVAHHHRLDEHLVEPQRARRWSAPPAPTSSVWVSRVR